jgi:hypothetical protein
MQTIERLLLSLVVGSIVGAGIGFVIGLITGNGDWPVAAVVAFLGFLVGLVLGPGAGFLWQMNAERKRNRSENRISRD